MPLRSEAAGFDASSNLLLPTIVSAFVAILHQALNRLLLWIWPSASSSLRMTLLFSLTRKFWPLELRKPLRIFFRIACAEAPIDGELGTAIFHAGNVLTYIITTLIVSQFSLLWSLLRICWTVLWICLAPLLLTLLICRFSSTKSSVADVAHDILNSVQPSLLFIGRTARQVTAVSYLVLKSLPSLLEPLWTTLGWWSKPTDFDYRPLDDGCIRLIHLSRRYPYGPIKLKLTAHQLDSCPPYEAISYNWGEPLKQQVHVNDQRMEITTNAFQALNSRASYFMPRVVWIDSICINQADTDEKESQVLLMGRIYSTATRVVICLGQADDALMTLAYVTDIYYKLTLRQLPPKAVKNLLQIGTNSSGWPALFKLLLHPYWSRTWIIQEVSLARNVYISYGDLLLGFDILSKVLTIMELASPGSFLVSVSLDNDPDVIPHQQKNRILSISHLRGQMASSNGLSLFKVLTISSRSLVSDPRDKIYGLLQLTDSDVRKAIPVSYRLDPEKIYISASIHLIRQPDSFWPLHRAGIGHRRTTKNLPSWVTDWNCHGHIQYLWFPKDSSPYRASGERGGGIRIDEDDKTVSVTGHIFDELDISGPSLDITVDTALTKSVRFGNACGDTLDATMAVAEKHGSLRKAYGFSRQSRREAFWRTLVGDRDTSTTKRPADEANAAAFETAVLFAQNPLETRDDEAAVMAYYRRLFPESAHLTGPQLSTHIDDHVEKHGMFWRGAGRAFSGRRFAITKAGRFAMIPTLAMKGDHVCIFNGAQTPFLIRTCEGRQYLVGECYVHGAMDGEVIGDESCNFVLH